MSVSDKLYQDLMSTVSEHRQLVAEIESISSMPPTNQEIGSLVGSLDGLSCDRRDISRAVDRIFSGPVRATAIAIHLTRQCDQGIENALSTHSRQLQPAVRSGLAKGLTARLLVLRERAAAIHNTREADVKTTIDKLIDKLESLPLPIRTNLTDAILADALVVSSVMLINKLHMLLAEMPDQVESEMLSAIKL